MKNEELDAILQRVTGVPASKLNDELGPHNVKNWDSLKHLQLLHTLERELSVEFDMDQLDSMQTIGKIRAVLHAKGILERL